MISSARLGIPLIPKRVLLRAFVHHPEAVKMNIFWPIDQQPVKLLKVLERFQKHVGVPERLISIGKKLRPPAV